MTLIINPRNKQQERVVKAFLSSLDIGFYSEVEEDAALVNARTYLKSRYLKNKLEERIVMSRNDVKWNSQMN
ncbi:hypothetical protein CLV53_1571, partial [Sediminibacterium magnilacihabitans]